MPLDDVLMALKLQLEDLELAGRQDKGKYVLGKPSDQIIAVNEYRVEIDRYKQFLEDQQLAQSTTQAIHDDTALLTEFTIQDVQAYEDRNYAVQLSNDDPEYQTPPEWVQGEMDSIKDWMSTMSEALQACSMADVGFADSETYEAGPSATCSERQANTLDESSEGFKCSTCLEQYHVAEMERLPCAHRFCAGCAKELFLRSAKDESLFPPRCCRQEIPLSLVESFMSSEEIDTFKAASIEFTTTDKTYCSNSACNRFIPSTTDTILPGTAKCRICATLTCIVCKGGYHHRRDCPKDPSLELTKELARELGWQECPQCHSLVELRSGCYHMTCRCKREFCYLCGVTWQGCDCIRADVGRLEERAVEIVDRDAGHVIAPAQRARIIDEVRDHLLEHHECTHSGRFQRVTTFRRAGYQCEICGTRHWKYILRCRHCFMDVCEECRRHRV